MISALQRQGARFELRGLRRVADRMLLSVAPAAGPEMHQLLVLDEDGRITRLLDYTDPDGARRDLARPVRGQVATVGRLVPFVDVRDVTASLAFYRLLGFEVRDEYRPEGDLAFAALRGGGAKIMLGATEAPVNPARQRGCAWTTGRLLSDGRRDRELTIEATGATGPSPPCRPPPRRTAARRSPVRWRRT